VFRDTPAIIIKRFVVIEGVTSGPPTNTTNHCLAFVSLIHDSVHTVIYLRRMHDLMLSLFSFLLLLVGLFTESLDPISISGGGGIVQPFFVLELAFDYILHDKKKA